MDTDDEPRESTLVRRHKPALPNLANLPGEPREVHGFGRLLYGTDHTGSIFQAHPFPLAAPFAFARRGLFLRALCSASFAGTWLFILSAQVAAKPHNQSTLLKGISLECWLRL